LLIEGLRDLFFRFGFRMPYGRGSRRFCSDYANSWLLVRKEKKGLAGKPANPFETYPITELA
jgi:hypothetical protein